MRFNRTFSLKQGDKKANQIKSKEENLHAVSIKIHFFFK